MTKYSEQNIERFAGLAGIRKKSSVYIGPNDSNGLWTIFREPADNGIDLALKGLNKHVHLVVDPNKKGYWVIDKGPGFPVGKKVFQDERGRSEKLSTFYVATGLTHAGSNFDSDEASRGTHGIGIKATNAMSRVFKVWTFRDGDWHCIEYKDAKLSKDVYRTKAPKLPHRIKVKWGSVLYFEPDMSLFAKGAKLSLSDVVEWCTLSAYLVPKIEIQLTTHSGKSKTWKTKGIEEYLQTRLEDLKAEGRGKPFVYHDKFADVAISFANAEDMQVRAYTNGLLNVDGGEHVKAVFDALVKSLKPYRKKKDDFKPSDLQDGLVGLINCKIAAPRFSNQRKDMLIDDRAYKPMYDGALKAFEEFWKKNKSLAKDVIQRAVDLRKKTADFLKDKRLMKNVKAAGKKMSTKLSDIANKKTPVEERELFLVEGDSASGTAKKARFNEFQATFALRGKPLNVMDAQKDKINKNEEVTGILAAIGLGEGKNEELRYGKIIFLADPDIDGKHINCLLMTLFWKFLPKLYKEGRLFMLHAPEYYTEIKKEIFFGDTPDEVYKQAGTKKCEIRHIKGWGELDAHKMVPMAFSKKTRKLIQLLPPKDSKGVKNFEALMGKNSTYRQKMLGVAE